MKQTVDRIVRASSLPLSVVIVGVGGADFSNMVSKGSLPTSLLVYIHISMLTWAIPIVDSVVLVDAYSIYLCLQYSWYILPYEIYYCYCIYSHTACIKYVCTYTHQLNMLL